MAPDVLRLALAAALGPVPGFEREPSQKPAGIRTGALISLLAAVFRVVESELLLAVGAILVVVQGLLFAVEGVLDPEERLSLTTSVSMLVAYGVGALVGGGVVVAVV